jgi:hypothetical protein
MKCIEGAYAKDRFAVSIVFFFGTAVSIVRSRPLPHDRAVRVTPARVAIIDRDPNSGAQTETKE